MKFGDVIVATASLVLIGFMLQTVLHVAFISVVSDPTSDVLAWIIALLVTSLIVGYVFALRIQEQSRIRAVGKIVVLSTLAVLLLTIALTANPMVNEWHLNNMASMFSTSGWTSSEWVAYSALLFTMDMVVVAVFSFIGLYAGSMLKKPKKA